MKICQLKLKNLNSFRGEQEIDFESELLSDASLVAITGPTGAGKTTLLDAICVALYGKTPRLSGTGSQNPSYLISHGEKEGFAEVLFMANGIRYLATWTAKQNGSPKVGLFFADDDKLITDKLSTRGKSLGSSENTVSEEVASILGLDFDAFRRSVMLAQGEFAAFLKANDEKRRTILEATAGISIYDVLKRTLNEKVAEVEAGYAELIKELEGIPEASHEQVAEARRELGRLQEDAKRVDEKNQYIQNEKQREEERKKNFEQFQLSEKRRKDLLGQQSEVDGLQAERTLAERAQRLRPEKQAYDTTESALENAEKAFRVATVEKTEAEEQVEIKQAVYEKKDTAYQTASNEHNQKLSIYTAAKLDMERAADQFVDADKRIPDLTKLDNQIDTLSSQLSDKQTEKSQLQMEIQTAQTYLDENPLPLDRQQRLNRATGLLGQLSSQEDQLTLMSTTKTECEEKVSSLKINISNLLETHREYLSKKEQTTAALKNASATLDELQSTGTVNDWTSRKQKAVEMQSIAQRYETLEGDLTDSEDRLCELNRANAGLDAELEQIRNELTDQTEVYRQAEKTVERCEDVRESALLADTVNHLRPHLHEGEPCPVCGATKHPFATVVDTESETLLRNAEGALENAKADARTAQAQLEASKTKQVEIQQNKRNTTKQIEEGTAGIEKSRNEMTSLLAAWQEVFPDTDVSSDWTIDQIARADTTIADIMEAEQAYIQEQHACETATQLLETCESNIENENQSLDETEEQLRGVSDDAEDLKVDIASTENSFWELLPETVQGIAAKVAVEQFDNKIQEIGQHERARDSAKTQLQVLNANIEADENKLQDLKDSREGLKTEIDKYRSEGETFLEASRQKTDGLETETEIDAAITKLEAELQAKEIEREDAERQLQKSQTLLIEKRTTHGHCEEQYEESVEKLQTAREVYFDRLQDAGFDSPEAHDNAFRDEAQMQGLIDQINAYEGEKQQLEVEITKLRTQFEETPFDPEALERIESQVEEINGQLQATQQEVWAQQEKIDTLQEALKKRESLGDEQRIAQQELERWQRLQETIPANKFRDFALEIMFKQMGSIANGQLGYLTSGRYQLKVEGIGDLTVIDRWNANEERPVETLSGGESFLTSLALALALSELSRGRAQLNSLFLDEGFGTLDVETLDIAIAALEGLQTQGRSIFLISHIQELTRRLPTKINVRKRGNGSSSIDIRG